MRRSEQYSGEGLIFDIQRFSIHDGPGIRTLLFFKGCPLRCSWCSNPEGQAGKEEILYNEARCIRCGRCLAECRNGAVKLEGPKILYNRDVCVMCGRCVEKCAGRARSISGRRMGVPQIIGILEKDEIFFRNSGGGVTLGGGEPTYQYDFALALLSECRRNNIHTSLETCGYLEWGKLSILLEYVDLVLYDVKHIDDAKHKRFTSVSNELILSNLKNILKMKQDIVIRVPVVPGFNDADKKMIEEFVGSIESGAGIEYINYHEYGKFKYGLLGRNCTYNP